MGLVLFPGPSWTYISKDKSRGQWRGVCGSEEAIVTAGNSKGAIRGYGASQTLRWWSECQGIVRDIAMPEHAYFRVYPCCRVHACPRMYPHSGVQSQECTYTAECIQAEESNAIP